MDIIKNFMSEQNLDYLLVNSTNEFLVEYNTLEENSRYKITNFSGSTGEALITPNTIYLFVDGRYHTQADLEVNPDFVTVVKLQVGQSYLEELLKKVPQDKTLGVFTKKNSQCKIEKISAQRCLKFLDYDPLDKEVGQKDEGNFVLASKYTGLTSEEKIKKVTQDLGDNEFLYVSDLDEVSYLFNMRNFNQKFSAKIKAKALISKNQALLFTQDKMKDLEATLRNLNGVVFVDKTSITAYDYNLLGDKARELSKNPIKLMKAQKTKAELAHLKDAFRRTDNAVSKIRTFIEENDKLSEADIANRLEQEFKNEGALGLSFNSIVAKDRNSALAHYSKSSRDEIISDGSLVLIDCGAYFEGGLATDITRVFVKGNPTELHKKIYTKVLKAFLKAYKFPQTHQKRPIAGFEVDREVREFFSREDLEGFVFNHGLGHGLGINVHEYPPSLSSGDLAKVPLLDGMCFSIEPGLYKEGFFGVRLENSCYYENDRFHSFVKMNYERKLINFEMLTEQEKEWLNEFEVK